MNSYIEKERDWGNIEYKIAFIDMTLQKKKKYATQLKFRVIEGSGSAIYMLGVMDNGKIVGIHKTNIDYTKNTMREICNEVECKLDETIDCFEKKKNLENSIRSLCKDALKLSKKNILLWVE